MRPEPMTPAEEEDFKFRVAAILKLAEGVKWMDFMSILAITSATILKCAGDPERMLEAYHVILERAFYSESTDPVIMNKEETKQ